MDTISTRKLTVVVAILAALCAYTWSLRVRAIPTPPPPALEKIPRSLEGYSSSDGRVSPETLDILGADLTLARSYVDSSGRWIELFIGYFADQQEYSQIHSPKHCYPGSGWDITDESPIFIDLAGSRSKARRLIISDGERSRLVVYWFIMNGRIISGEFALKWHQMVAALLSRPQAAVFIRFSTAVPPEGIETERTGLVRFIEGISPDILAALSPAQRRNGS